MNMYRSKARSNALRNSDPVMDNTRPIPEHLGTGAAANAGRAMRDRRRTVDQSIDESLDSNSVAREYEFSPSAKKTRHVTGTR